ncbi:MAG: TlyA family rRNA (cytidine-2'-O)-methyltransferase [Acidobacteria bacterium]|nr:TlyA family rRNA (cytidine-2'-O)-methyltransferase [Acidobacteriota bacterium]
MTRVRLDTLLHERGLADSRTRGKALVLAGQVRVNGSRASKAGTLVSSDANVTLDTPDHPYVGRGGVKLAHALDAFNLNPVEAQALDIGASTGGFTDVLLQRGADHVVALDVGHGQLAWRLRCDPRVTVLERLHIGTVTPNHLPVGLRQFDIITVDVSFISIRYFIGRLPTLLKRSGNLVVLVKPQFEAGREEVGRGGLVKDPNIHRRVVAAVVEAASEVGLIQLAMAPSPITGADGNQEFFLQLRHSARP